MPRYRYQCDKCEHVIFEIRDAKDRDTVKVCGDYAGLPIPCTGQLLRQFPIVAEPTVLDTVDPYRNIKHRKDQQKRIEKRAKDHFIKHEMDETIAKAGEKDARKMGWVDKNGKKNK